MKHILAVLMLLSLAACASSSRKDDYSSELKHLRPPECLQCGNIGRRVGDCSAISGSCMARCTGDASMVAVCQGICASEYGSCVSIASVQECPAHCTL